jgi:hypothetical protein
MDMDTEHCLDTDIMNISIAIGMQYLINQTTFIIFTNILLYYLLFSLVQETQEAAYVNVFVKGTLKKTNIFLKHLVHVSSVFKAGS